MGPLCFNKSIIIFGNMWLVPTNAISKHITHDFTKKYFPKNTAYWPVRADAGSTRADFEVVSVGIFDH